LSTADARITVYVDTRPVTLYRGMQVRHALISCGQSLYDAALKGALYAVDEHGFRLGLEGALSDGARIFLRRVGSQCSDSGS